MLLQPMAKIFWGFSDFTGIYYFAMGYGASLMLAWTILLYWAYRKPMERRYVALLTSLILACFVVTEIVAISNNYIQLSKVVPSFVLQAILLIIFNYSFIISRNRKIAKG
jgi:Na+/pantothenate symporter